MAIYTPTLILLSSACALLSYYHRAQQASATRAARLSAAAPDPEVESPTLEAGDEEKKADEGLLESYFSIAPSSSPSSAVQIREREHSRFKNGFLVVYGLVMAADWLQVSDWPLCLRPPLHLFPTQS